MEITKNSADYSVFIWNDWKPTNIEVFRQIGFDIGQLQEKVRHLEKIVEKLNEK